MTFKKYDRNYELYVATEDGDTIRIGLPFTIEFDITRNTLTSANVCQLRIYNLSKLNRNRIRFNISNYGGPYREIVFTAGYGSNLSKIFSGNISQAWSVREGVDFITQIECYDGGYAFLNGVTNKTFVSGTPQREVIRSIMGDLPNVSVGKVGNYQGTLMRGNVYSGNSADILRQITGTGFFVDGQKSNALMTNEYIAEVGQRLKINARTGLLGTPLLEQSKVRFDMLFEPSLNVGTSVEIESLTEDNFNGIYKVTGVKHRGVISSAVSGSAITTGEFFYSKQLIGV